MDLSHHPDILPCSTDELLPLQFQHVRPISVRTLYVGSQHLPERARKKNVNTPVNYG